MVWQVTREPGIGSSSLVTVTGVGRQVPRGSFPALPRDSQRFPQAPPGDPTGSPGVPTGSLAVPRCSHWSPSGSQRFPPVPTCSQRFASGSCMFPYAVRTDILPTQAPRIPCQRMLSPEVSSKILSVHLVKVWSIWPWEIRRFLDLRFRFGFFVTFGESQPW